MAFGITWNSELYGIDYARDMFFLANLSLRPPRSSQISPAVVYSLSIEKLPSSSLMIDGRDIPDYLRNIRRLEIGTAILETNAFGPSKIQIHRGAMYFYTLFPQFFLAPASHSIRVLHLSADAPWGWYPKIDLRGIHFPCLESLTLSRFTFSHDWQMYWLSHHADTLKRLSLINCAILCHATSTYRNYNLDSEGYPRRYEYFDPDGTITGSYHYRKRWSNCFLGLACILPYLQSFSLVAPAPETRDTHRRGIPNEEKQALCANDRYLKYTSAFYTPYCFERSDEERSQTEQDKADRQAFRKLFDMIRWRESTQNRKSPLDQATL